jgi:hypothetical protein
LDGFCKYVLQLRTSFLIKSCLFTSAFNMSDSERNLLKSALGISSNLLYLPLVSGDNNFFSRSGVEINFSDVNIVTEVEHFLPREQIFAP